MAKIHISTLTENCWLHCPNFKIDRQDFIENGSVVHRILACENLKMCKHAVEEDKKCHNKSQEEK